jgi:hypothetical protein
MTSTVKSALAPLSRALSDPPAWLSPYISRLRQIVPAAQAQSVAAALNATGESQAPVRFVGHDALPAGEPYESFIARTGCVPTRDNLHDLFNGLMWLDWPQTKRRLNRLQAEHIERHGASGPRGALRDALTVFDENAAVLRAPPGLAESLRRRDWRTLFVTQRAQWRSAHLALFGHALLEKLLQPRKAITAHVWLMDVVTDDALAASLTRERLLARPFLPLPVLGVPGWWGENESLDFYDDGEVFRPAQSQRRPLPDPLPQAGEET